MPKLNAGIVGLGVGAFHIEGYNKHPDCEVVAVCDFSRGKIEKIKQRYPDLVVTTRAADILNNPNINAVSIASFDNYHYEQIMCAVLNNKHVFVEKPLCLHVEEAKAIRKAFDEKPHLKLSSNLILRKCPRFIKVKEMIKNGVFGEVFSIEGDYNYGRLPKITEGWRGELDFYSVFYGGGVHMVDLLSWLLEDKVEEVAAFGNRIAAKGTRFKYNDFTSTLLKFSSGAIGKVSANFGCVYPHFHRLIIYGTEATFINEREFGILIKSRDANVVPTKIDLPYPGYQKGDLIFDFVDSILRQKSPEVDIEVVLQTMSICFAVEEAVTQKEKVTVQYI